MTSPRNSQGSSRSSPEPPRASGAIMGGMEKKKLYRSREDRKLAGVCGGLGEYLDIDSTVIRVLWMLIVLLTGIFPGIIAYIVAIFIIPEKGAPGANHERHQ